MRLASTSVLFASLVLAGCHTPYRVAVKDGSAQYLNGTEELTLDTESAAAVTLHYSVHAQAGSLLIEVIAPGGSVAGSLSQTNWPDGKLELPGIAGRWTCKLRFTGFRGDYKIKLEQGG